MSDPAETSNPPFERNEGSSQQDPNVANRVASRIRFQPTGRVERRPTGAATFTRVPAPLQQPVSAVEDEAEEEEYELDGEEEDADEEDGDFDEDFGEEEDEGFEDSEGESFEEEFAEDQEQARESEGIDPNREPTAREKAVMMLEINRPLYPVYRGILAEVNLINSIRIQHSYVKLPENFKFGEASGRKDDPIAEKELNDLYVGAPPYLRSSKFAILANPAKDSMLRGEDKLYEADIQLYQARMCLFYLEEYLKASSDSSQKLKSLSKYKRHIINIDTRLKDHDISSEHELIKLRTSAKESEDAKYNAANGTTILYARSIQQLFYNSTSRDREFINSLTKDFVDERRLLYETILESNLPINLDHLKNLCLPLSTVHRALQIEPGVQKSTVAASVAIPEELPTSSETAVPKAQSKVVVRNLIQSPTRLRKISADTSKVWPIVNVDVNLNTPLHAAFSVLMDTQEAIDYDPESHSSSQILLHKLVGRAFGISKIDMLTSSATTDAADGSRFSMACELLLTHKSQIVESVDQEINAAGVEPLVDVTGPLQSHTLMMDSFLTKLKAGQEYAQLLEFFKEGEKELNHIFCEEVQTKTILLFLSLYQRFAFVWKVFERVARQNPEFDIVKMFSNFKLFVLKGLVIGDFVPGVPDPELLIIEVFGKFAPQLYNLPLIIKRILKRIQGVSIDYIYLEFLEAQMKPEFCIKGYLTALQASPQLTKPVGLQICSFDKKARRLYIHNLQFTKSYSAEEDRNSVMQEESKA